MSPTSVLKSLGALGTAVLAAWLGMTGAIEPPVESSVGFFLVLCSVVGLLLAAALQLMRRSAVPLRPWIFIVAGVAALAGIASFLKYHAEWERRVAMTGDPDAGAYVVIADRIVPEAVEVLRRNDFAFCRDAVHRRDLHIPIACAKEAAAHLQGGTDQLFDPDALDDSRRVLSAWYQTMSACFLLAIFLAVDEVLASVRLKRRKR
jgi:hypothetical protein